MKDFKGVTRSEDFLIKAIQQKLGIFANGWVGCQTMCALAQHMDADCFPLTLEIYGQPMLICRDVIPASVRRGLEANEISGSFSNGTHPVSILVGETAARWASCHSEDGCPESVLYRGKDGAVGLRRVKSIEELPPLKWAVGGMGLLDNYNPKAEGFTGRFCDVLRRTNHTVIGEKNGYFYLMYLRDKTAREINDFCRDKMKLDKAVMLDGGHIAAINGAERFSKINVRQRQLYVIRAL